MNGEKLHGFHENVFASGDPHILIHANTQTDNYKNHWHTPLEILMPVENTYKAFVNGKQYDLRPFDILIVTPNVYHAYEAPLSGIRYFLLVDVSILKDILGISSVLKQLNPSFCFTPENAPEIHERLKEIVLMICESYFNQSVPLASSSGSHLNSLQPPTAEDGSAAVPEIIIYGKLLEMLSLISVYFRQAEHSAAPRQNNQDFVNKFTFICNYIDQHLAEPLSCEQMAGMANFSKYHFSRLFKEFTNESFYRYVNIKRIRYAEQLLLHQDMSVTDIALSCGYSNASSFIRMFKQINGHTPREFRAKKKYSGY